MNINPPHSCFVRLYFSLSSSPHPYFRYLQRGIAYRESALATIGSEVCEALSVFRMLLSELVVPLNLVVAPD
jgi:hypothetical protein